VRIGDVLRNTVKQKLARDERGTDLGFLLQACAARAKQVQDIGCS
jgi:hypothetical protein